MTFESIVHRDLGAAAKTSNSFTDDLNAWIAAIRKIVTEYGEKQKALHVRKAVRNGAIGAVLFFVVLTLCWNVKVGAVAGCIMAVIAFTGYMGDSGRFKADRYLHSEARLPDEVLGMLADAPDTLIWLKMALAHQVDENGAASWRHLAWTLEQMSGVISDARARQLSGAQRLMKYIKPGANDDA